MVSNNDRSTPKALALGTAVRRAREKRGVSLRKVAGAIERDPSELSRWETGKRVPRERDVVRILSVLGVNGTEYEEIVELVSDAEAPLWLAITQPEQQQQLNAVLEFERTAEATTEVSPLLVPGVLQTSAYIRAIMTSGGVPAGEVATRIAVRIGRRDVITRSNPANLLALVGEAALRQIIGSRATMAEQLRYLLELAELPNIDLRAVSFDSGWHPALEGPFTLIRSAEGQSEVVHLETRRSGLFLHEEQDINSYRSAVDTVRETAMSSAATTKLITEIANQMEAAQ